MNATPWNSYLDVVAGRSFHRLVGRVTRVSNLVIEATGLAAFVGELCTIEGSGGRGGRCQAEVVGLREDKVLLMPFGETRGIGTDSEVVGSGLSVSVPVGEALLGRVIDPLGHPLDSKALHETGAPHALRGAHRNPLSRRRITEVFDTGLRAVDAFLTLGKGQRVGIFAGSGVGKSTLLGMIARKSRSDVNVIALIGERGREVGEFLERILGPEGIERSVVVVATSDQPALVRELAAHTATAVAEYFCGEGRDVLLIMDSVTRFVMAHREIGLAVGEPATARGYTPSAFAALPKLLERAGAFEGSGSITGIYTVLVEGDDLHEPVSDHMRAILDGHVVLSRDLANHGHYPAIDVLKSVSRLAPDLWGAEERTVLREVQRLMSVRERHRDMIEIGAYRAGSNDEVDRAIAVFPKLERFFVQEPDEHIERAELTSALKAMLQAGKAH